MKTFLYLLFLGIQIHFAYGETYALIIGISEYQDQGIKDLQFADDDAVAFRNFLLSKPGGAIDSNNIVLLLNEHATVGEIYAAKRMLETKVKKNDLVYFYFSGHGGVESDIYKSGFLLAHDTPINNFQNNAVEILHINKMANTFSASTKANVILITDACRSGSLGGIDDVGKKLLLQDQLVEANKREIRMASCQHDQLSLENQVWGGGRGLFSYELLKGLNGDADENQDLKITLQELKNYLNQSMLEEVDKFLLEPQTPIFDGEDKTILSKVTSSTPQSTSVSSTSMAFDEGNTRSVTAVVISTNDHFFDLLEQNFFSSEPSFQHYSQQHIDDFVEQIFSAKLYLPSPCLKEDSIYFEQRFETIKSEIHQDANAYFAFKQKLAASIHNVIQEALNSYLSIDKDELERRQFYNANGHLFRNYASLIDLALNAISINSELREILLMKKWYFLGLANRIDITKSGNADSLINEAIFYQEEAEKINENAAYVQNELGILYEYKKAVFKAEEKYKRATQLVPGWALPYSNLSNLYYTMGRYEEGIRLAKRALEINPSFNLVYFGLGRNSIKTGNYLLAKESYLKAIRLNPNHYVPYKYLGELYIQTAEFDLANHYLVQAERLKNMAYDRPMDNLLTSADVSIETAAGFSGHNVLDLLIDTVGIQDESNVLRLFFVGKKLNKQNVLHRIIEIDPSNFMGHLALADHYYKEGNFMQAEYLYQKSISSHIDQNLFNETSSSLVDAQDSMSNVYLDFYQNEYKTINDIKEKMGDLYYDWGMHYKAIFTYDQLIEEIPTKSELYYKTWYIHEKNKNFQKAEQTINRYQAVDSIQAYKERFALYKRAIYQSADPDYYTIAAGDMMYDVFTKEQINPYFFSDTFVELIENAPVLDRIDGGINYQFLAELPTNPIQEAIRLYEKVNNTSIYFEQHQIAAKLGRLYGSLGHLDQTKAYFYLAAQHPISKPYAKEYLSLICEKNYDLTEAFEHLSALNHSNQLDYDNTLRMIEYAALAGEHLLADSLVKIVKSFKPSISNNLSKIEAFNHYTNGNPQKAIKAYLNLIKKDPENPFWPFAIFRIYAQQSNLAEADPYLGQALNKGMMQYGTVVRYDPYAYKGMYRFTQLASGILGSVLTTKQ